MDRRYVTYKEVPQEAKLVMWKGINQGRMAFHTLVDYAQARRAHGKNGNALSKVDEVITRYSTQFIDTPPIGEYPKPASLREAVDEIQVAHNEFNEVVRLNLPLVRFIALSNTSLIPPESMLSFDDLEGHGRVGLVQAANKYDHTVNTDFGKYAPRRIAGAMVDAIRALAPFSRDDADHLKKITTEIQEFWVEHGKDPTSKELAQRTGLDSKTVAEAIALSRLQVVSIDERSERDDADVLTILNEASKAELLRSSNDEPYSDSKLVSLRNALASGILSDRELKLVNFYFFKELTLGEIATEMGFSTSRASQIKNAILKKLRTKVS
jgi:RNA polymerase sigma factor for flagellar operon FliA